MAKRADILERFGKRVRKLRSEAGYSQEGFAAHVGLDRTYHGGVERGQRNIALRNVEKIAKGLKISVAELFEGI
jgi:transcriptional regulator with XRE-family HTH domain